MSSRSAISLSVKPSPAKKSTSFSRSESPTSKPGSFMGYPPLSMNRLICGVVELGAPTNDLGVFACGVDPIGQQYREHFVLEVAPHARSGVAGMSKTGFGEEV